MNKNGWLYLFLADLAAELLGIALDLPALQLLAKPLIVPLLMVWLLVSAGEKSFLRWAVLLALFFSWLGDIFLLMDSRDPLYFMAGLGSFLLAHCVYILYFLRVRKLQKNPHRFNGLLAVAVALYSLGLVLFLLPHLGGLKIPVTVYALAITLMLVSALHAYGPEQVAAGRWSIGGALLFVISDSCLALNKFYQPFAGAGLLIMLTYALAQLLLVKGALLYLAGAPAPASPSPVPQDTGKPPAATNLHP